MNNFVEISSENLEQINGGKVNWWKCGLGTFSGFGLGVLSGAGKTIELGPYSIYGAAIGAVAGTAGGAAASCF